MEAQTDLQTYMERGKEALARGQARDAAIAYAHAAQLDPNNPMVHLGLAEANLALSDYRVVRLACQRVQELQPAGGSEAMTAQALLDLLNHRYERALQDIDAVISEDPSIAYAHALRSYLLRILHQDYDANLARARAGRLSYGGHFDNCFPPIEQSYASGYSMPPAPPFTRQAEEQTVSGPRPEREPVPTWTPPNSMQRQIVRTRFALSQRPTIVTNAIIGINLVIYAILAVLSQSLDISQQVLINAGAQNTPLIEATGEYWRIFTAMFLHFTIFHVGLNMLSLFFIGGAVEGFYGKWRYLAIYLVSGLVGGISTFFLQPDALAAGASGAIFGVFGALGVLYLVNRRVFRGSGAIASWLFWLSLNLVWGFSNTSIGIIDHLGGLVAGMIIAYLLMPRFGRRSI